MPILSVLWPKLSQELTSKLFTALALADALPRRWHLDGREGAVRTHGELRLLPLTCEAAGVFADFTEGRRCESRYLTPSVMEFLEKDRWHGSLGRKGHAARGISSRPQECVSLTKLPARRESSKKQQHQQLPEVRAPWLHIWRVNFWSHGSHMFTPFLSRGIGPCCYTSMFLRFTVLGDLCWLYVHFFGHVFRFSTCILSVNVLHVFTSWQVAAGCWKIICCFLKFTWIIRA